MTPFSILVGHLRSSGCLLSPIHHLLFYFIYLFLFYLFVLLFFCLSVSISLLHLSKVPIDGAHVTDICCISWASRKKTDILRSG